MPLAPGRQKERGARALELTLGHDKDAIAEDVRFVHEVGGEENHPPLPLSLQKLPDRAARVRIHPTGRLVQENEAGVSKESHRHAQLPLHAATEVLGPGVVLLSQAHLFCSLAGRPGAWTHHRDPPHGDDRDPLVGGDELQMLPDGELIVQDAVLGTDPHLLPDLPEAMKRVAADAHAIDVDAPRGWRKQAGQDPDRRGLSGAVVAQKTGDLPFVQVKRQIVHGAVPSNRATLLSNSRRLHPAGVLMLLAGPARPDHAKQTS
eukprot:scaffold3867_cov254-Pinguiococcus_pyrenoidosus.AAC.11